jgi:hypothetical protein
MKFKLEITMGNDVMQTGADISKLLRGLATALEHAGAPEEGRYASLPCGVVMDDNGNKVGKWFFMQENDDDYPDRS